MTNLVAVRCILRGEASLSFICRYVRETISTLVTWFLINDQVAACPYWMEILILIEISLVLYNVSSKFRRFPNLFVQWFGNHGSEYIDNKTANYNKLHSLRPNDLLKTISRNAILKPEAQWREHTLSFWAKKYSRNSLSIQSMRGNLKRTYNCLQRPFS